MRTSLTHRTVAFFRIAGVSAFLIALASQGNFVTPATGAVVSWDHDTGFWSNPSHWTPAVTPDLGDTVMIGNLPGVANEDVVLDQNDAITELHITDGMTLGNDDHTFSVLGDTFLSGLNIVPFGGGGGGVTYQHSRIFIRPTPAPIEFTTHNLTVTDEARVRLYQGGDLEVRGTLSTDPVSSIYGEGSIRFIRDGLALVNSGVIEPAGGGIDFDVTSGGILDLDGAGNGEILLQWGSEFLTINGGTANDPFSGSITIDGDTALNMNLDAPWEADSTSEIVFGWPNNGIQYTPSIISGADVTIAGAAPVTTGAHARIDANVTLASTIDVSISSSGRFETNAAAVIEGGTYVLDEDAEMNFDGATTVEGGEFTTFSNLGSDGFVRFNGETNWQGIVSVNGIAQQFGDASVTGLTNISAGVFDLDGGGNTVWDIGHLFTVNAESIDSTLSNTFDGTLNIGGVLGNLNVRLNGSFDEWVMNGEMHIINNLPFSSEKIDGSPMRIAGEVSTDGIVRFSADTTFGSGSQTTFADAAAVLAMQQVSHVEAGAAFIGTGTLQNQNSGEMTLADGATLDQVALLNQGLLEIGDSAGVASVDSLVQGNEATWLVEIGGYVAGNEFDLLQVTGADAQLDGHIEVELIDAGSGLFLPEVGDEFTVMTSVGNVTNSFLADPVSFAAGQEFQWEVLYHPHDVTLRLVAIESIVPEPASCVLMSLAAVSIALRRERRGARNVEP